MYFICKFSNGSEHGLWKSSFEKKKRVLSFGSIELQVEGVKINLYHILKIFNYKKRHQKENEFFESAKSFPIWIHSHENVTARYPGYPKKKNDFDR